VLPALVVSLGLLGGSMTGAVAGFSIGLLVDGLMVEALGATSLVLLSTGYLAGPSASASTSQRLRRSADVHGADPLSRGRLPRRAGDAGHRFPVSLLIVQRHAAQIHIRLLPRWPIYLAVRRILRPALDRGADGPTPLAERAGN